MHGYRLLELFVQSMHLLINFEMYKTRNVVQLNVFSTFVLSVHILLDKPLYFLLHCGVEFLLNFYVFLPMPQLSSVFYFAHMSKNSVDFVVHCRFIFSR